jgi:hypothetical protein
MLAAAAVLSVAAVPAFAQDTQCPQGTTATTPTDGSPVTCQADDSTDDTTGAPEGAAEATGTTGDNPLDATKAGEGVQETVTNPDNKGGGNN